MKDAYVTAFIKHIQAGKSVDTALTNLKAIMQKKGHGRLLAQVLKAAMRELSAILPRERAVVTYATEVGVDATKLDAALTAVGYTKDSELETKIDPTIIGGLTVRFKGKQLDASYKRALRDLYTRVTS